MSSTAQVTGSSADRFRAYTVGPMTRKPTAEDHIKLAAKGQRFRHGGRVNYAVEHVAFEGKMDDPGALALDAGDVEVTKVVFYRGPIESEEVVGSVEVNAAGLIEIELVEPPPEEGKLQLEEVAGVDETAGE